jgi:hypothetical protein
LVMHEINEVARRIDRTGYSQQVTLTGLPNGSRRSCVPQADRAAGTAWLSCQRVTQVGRSELWHVSFSRLLGGRMRRWLPGAFQRFINEALEIGAV